MFIVPAFVCGLQKYFKTHILRLISDDYIILHNHFNVNMTTSPFQ